MQITDQCRPLLALDRTKADSRQPIALDIPAIAPSPQIITCTVCTLYSDMYL